MKIKNKRISKKKHLKRFYFYSWNFCGRYWCRYCLYDIEVMSFQDLFIENIDVDGKNIRVIKPQPQLC